MAPSGPPHTLLLTRKSSEFTSNLVALLQAAGSSKCSAPTAMTTPAASVPGTNGVDGRIW